jgi:sugar lactone lactonase YvrE
MVNGYIAVSSGQQGHRVYFYSTNPIVPQDAPAHFLGGLEGTTMNQLDTPVGGLVFDAATHRLFVSDTENNRILVYDVLSITNGENAVHVLGQADFTSNGAATTANRLNYPRGLTLYETMLYVADEKNNRIMGFDTASLTDGMNADHILGQNNFMTSSQGVGDSSMYRPKDVFAYGDILFVADSGNNRILIFDLSAPSNGQAAINEIGQVDFDTAQSGLDAFSLSGPSGIFVLDSYLFVTDTNNNRVIYFSHPY